MPGTPTTSHLPELSERRTRACRSLLCRSMRQGPACASSAGPIGGFADAITAGEPFVTRPPGGSAQPPPPTFRRTGAWGQ